MLRLTPAPYRAALYTSIVPAACPTGLRMMRVAPWNRQHPEAALARLALGSGGEIGSALGTCVPFHVAFALTLQPHSPVSAFASRKNGVASTSMRSVDARPKLGLSQMSSGSTVCSGPLTVSPERNETSVH